MASFSYLLTYALVHVAVIVVRRADPEEYEPDFELSSWAYPTIPILGGLSCVVIITQMRPIVLAVGGAIVLLGMLWYFAYAARRAIKPSLVGEAILEAVAEYDTVCLGATRSTAVRQALFGSIPEEIGEAFEGTVVITRCGSTNRVPLPKGSSNAFPDKASPFAAWS